jgi:hypothetical protein
MFTMNRSTRGVLAISTLAVCLAGMTDLAHAQRQRVARRPETVTTVANPDSAATFTRQVVTAKITGTQRCLPPHVRGDDEFSGNWPRVEVRVQFLVHNNAVYRRVYMRAIESGRGPGGLIGGAPTEARGWSSMQRVWSPPAGQTIVQLMGVNEKTRLVNERFKGHGKHVRKTEVGTMKIVGDSKGFDAGGKTRVDVEFDYNLPVVVQKYSPKAVRVQFPRTVEYTPPHTKGDRDFKGHGPRVNIEVYVMHTRRQITFEVSMHARETKKDWTTASGRHSQVMYKAPAGKYIKAVHGKQKWYKLVSYVDTDHEVDRFNNPELGLIRVWGDTSSHIDAGYETRVIFENIQRSLLVELADE